MCRGIQYLFPYDFPEGNLKVLTVEVCLNVRGNYFSDECNGMDLFVIFTY